LIYLWTNYKTNLQVLFTKRAEQIVKMSNTCLPGLLRTNTRVNLKNVLNETHGLVLGKVLKKSKLTLNLHTG